MKIKPLNLSGAAFSAALLSAAATVPASAQSSRVCSAWNVDRSVEVIVPGDNGDACKVLYRKPDEDASDQVLWRSTHSVTFCETKATELTAKLGSAGFNCSEGRISDADSVARNVSLDEKDRQDPAPPSQIEQASVAAGSSALPTQGATASPINYPSAFATDAKWHLAGYADATFMINDTGGKTKTEFSSANFNPIFYFQYKDFLLLEAETEISVDNDGNTDLELEFAQADLLLHDNVTLVVGQFLSPVGQFQERLHPSWINKLANAPAGFHEDGAQPASDVGAMLRGGVSVGDRSIATYAVAVSNGPRVSPEGAFEVEGAGGDDNSNKAISGRIGFLPVPYLEVGGSFLTGKVTGEEAPDEIGGLDPTTAQVTLFGADAAYTRGPWSVRGEYLHAKRDPINTATEDSDGVEMLPSLTMEAWYGQIAYRLSEITDNDILQRFEPVVRYGRYRIAGLDELAEELAEKRLDVGLNYWIAPSVVVHAAGEWRDFTDRPDEEPNSETKFLLQFAYGF